ncbi:hypothetical protein GCM10028806_05450 [Spirosoma terrae]|uniref:Uncharacterized protein n=1 Tax=Spirosoma terrae TaxID=1968276 RepID=A0A6L9L8J3_9BACT|nr:hypothetical protein [Spirosoma terrae]NDU96874.1 hypothetical protein [Spirosoma terrae]
MNYITSTGKDIRHSTFWAFELEIETSSNLDLPMALSGAEIVLDALWAHLDKAYEELEYYTEKWHSGLKEGKSVVLDDSSQKEIILHLEQVKVLTRYIACITNDLGADLREIGNAINRKEGSHE